MRRTFCALRLVPTALAVAPGIVLMLGCSASPGQPTQVFVGPKASCPAPVSMPSPSGQSVAVSYGNAIATGGTPPTTVSCTPANGAIFPIGVTTVTCTATDQVSRTDSCTFTVTVTTPPRLSVTRFLAFGDSMTWGEDGTNAVMSVAGFRKVRPFVQLPAPQRYPNVLQTELAMRYTAQSPQVTNAGKAGETVTDPLTFPRLVSFTSTGSYDVLLLMEGANDLQNNDVPNTIAGLGRMIDDAKSRNMKVFLATIPPENPNGFDPFDRGLQYMAVAPFNDLVRGLASSKSVALVDVYQAFGGNLTLIGNDGLHPTADGYKLIADTFFASIKQNLELPATASSNPTRVLRWFAPPRR